jgi:23S rRNA pseudouridine2604 synthase
MDDNHISLNKYISDTGYCSRRDADKLIEAGRVRINEIVARKGNRATSSDQVYIDNILVVTNQVKPIYIALNKPIGIVCTTDNFREKDNIIDFIGYKDRIFPIGRLDKMSQGLILLTNDGDIVNKILRAGNYHEKEYVVSVDTKFDTAFIKSMSTGVPILDTVTNPCKVVPIDEYTFSITLTQGLNRQIRRMCEFLGYRVRTLNRVRIMHLTTENIPYGKWKLLNEAEIQELMEMVKDSRK